MSKICGKSSYCQFAPTQNSGGCPCAEQCKDYCKDSHFVTSTTSEPDLPWYHSDNTGYRVIPTDIKTTPTRD